MADEAGIRGCQAGRVPQRHRADDNQAGHALTFKLDHSMGTDQNISAKSSIMTIEPFDLSIIHELESDFRNEGYFLTLATPSDYGVVERLSAQAAWEEVATPLTASTIEWLYQSVLNETHLADSHGGKTLTQ